MRYAGRHHLTAQGGVTLIESIIALVLLGIASVAISALQGKIFFGQSGNKDMEVGVQLAQECAEKILATRRKGGGYAAVSTSTCSTGTFGGFAAPAVTLLDNLGGTTTCGSTSTTCTVTITMNKSGSSVASITLRLANY